MKNIKRLLFLALISLLPFQVLAADADVIFSDDTANATSGTGEQTLATIPIAAGKVVNGSLDFQATVTRNSSGASNCTVRGRLNNDTTGAIYGSATVSTIQTGTIMNGGFKANGSTSSQIGWPGAFTVAPTTSSVDLTNATNVYITGECTNGGDSITYKNGRGVVYE